MRKLIFSLFLSLGVLASYAQSTEEIVRTHLEKLGGVKKLKAMRSIIRKMTLYSQGQTISMTEYYKRPNWAKIVLKIQGKDFVSNAYDGKQAWHMNDLGIPERLSSSETSLMRNKDFDRLWIDYKQRGHKVELQRKERVKGQLCHKLLVIKKYGQQIAFFISVKDYMVLKMEQIKESTGAKITRYYSDYRKVGGLMFAHKISGTTAKTSYKIEVYQVQVNPHIADQVFKYPGEN